VLVQRRHRLGRIVEVVARVEGVVAHEFDRGAVERIAPRLGDDVDQRRRLAAELRRVERFLNLEFLDRVDRGADDEVVEVLVGDLDAVEQIDVVAAALTEDCRQRAGLLERRAARPAGRQHDAVAQLRELEELPAVERQQRHLAVVDDVADLGGRRLQQRRHAGHRHRLGAIAERQRDRHVEPLPDLQRDVRSRHCTEAVETDGQRVLTDRQRGQEEAAAGVGGARDAQPAGDVHGDDRRARQDAADRIGDDALNLRGVGLRVQRCGQRAEEQRECDDEPRTPPWKAPHSHDGIRQ